MRKLSPEWDTRTDTQAAAVRIPASSVGAPNPALSTLPPAADRAELHPLQ